MKKIKELCKKINELYAGHKFLLVITYVSIIFAICYNIWLFNFMLSTYHRLCDIILLLPYGFIPFIFLIVYFILCKFVPKVSKYVNIIINTILFLVVSYFFYSLLELTFERNVFDYLPYNPQKYHAVIEHLFDKDQDYIKLFFPKEIPANARNVEFKQLFYVHFDDYDYGMVQLKFKTIPEYIKEIKSKNYNTNISDNIKYDVEYLKNKNKGLKSNDVIYQVIDEDVCINNDHDGYLIGYIAVDNKNNEVLYRYFLHKNKKNPNICKGKKMYYMK